MTDHPRWSPLRTGPVFEWAREDGQDVPAKPSPSDLTFSVVEEHVAHALALRAKATGRPLQEVANEALRRGLMLDPATRLAVSRSARALQPHPVDVDTTAMIRRLRDGSEPPR